MTDTMYGILTRKEDTADVRIERVYDFAPAELWSALTDRQRIAGWLGDITGDLRAGGTYRAELGKAVGTSTGRIIACEPERRLLVSWQFVGAEDTELEAWLSDVGSGKTRLTLENRGIAIADVPAGYSAGWHVFFDRLGEVLGTGTATSFIDEYSAAFPVYDDQLNASGVINTGPDDDRGTVQFDRTYSFSPSEVWSAITDPDRLGRWLGAVTGDLKPGGSYQLNFGDGDEASGRIVACDEPTRLEVTWEFPGEGTTHLKAAVTPVDGGARLMLTHSDLRMRDLGQYGAGWHTFLDHLDVVLGGGDPSGWHRRYEELHSRYAAQLPG